MQSCDESSVTCHAIRGLTQLLRHAEINYTNPHLRILLLLEPIIKEFLKYFPITPVFGDQQKFKEIPQIFILLIQLFLLTSVQGTVPEHQSTCNCWN
jgi:hypothetical protein